VSRANAGQGLQVDGDIGDRPRHRGSETIYVGRWTGLGRAVFTDRDGESRPLRLAQPALARGYAWGRAGAGPREVARAILLNATDNEMLSERLCRPFTWEVIANLPPGGFQITKRAVLGWVEGRPEGG
jgi:hypothetical protein